jgi:hypothetical protein
MERIIWTFTLLDGSKITFTDLKSMDYFITRNYLFVSKVETIIDSETIIIDSVEPSKNI